MSPTAPPPTIAPWTPADRREVIDLIVSIQQGEFDLAITADDQPDLSDVERAYRDSGGEFWVARSAAGDVVGTVAAIAFEPGSIALRKMFVHRSERGTGLAAQLMETVLAWAAEHGHREVVLGTTSVMRTAHRFYERHGFTHIDVDELPPGFPRMAVDSLFFRRAGAPAGSEHR